MAWLLLLALLCSAAPGLAQVGYGTGDTPPEPAESPLEPIEKLPATVFLTNGAVYRNVRITPDYDEHLLRLDRDEQPPLSVAFHRVERIVAMGGRDVTRQVLRDPIADRVVESGPPLESPWSFWVMAAPTFALPMGMWYDGATANVGFAVMTSVAAGPQASVDFSVQYQPLGVEEGVLRSVESALRQAGAESATVHEFGYSVLKISGGLRYIQKSRTQPLWGYVGGGVGGYQHRSSLDVTVDGLRGKVAASETEFALTGYGGAIYKLSPSLGIDLGARFDTVLGTVSNLDGSINGYLLEFKGGVVMGF